MIFDKLIHFPNKVFFPILKKDEEIREKFNKFGFIHEINKVENINFASEINESISKIDLSSIINSKLKINPKSYSIDIFDHLDITMRERILNFFNNQNKIKLVSSMLNYKAKLRKVCLLINFCNELTKEEEGPKMFHRDSDSLQDQIKIFLLINNINNQNGMFYFIPKNIISEKKRLPYESKLKNLSIKDKWRTFDKTIFTYAKKNNIENPIQKLFGTSGELLYVDTGKVYHKGGYINDKDKFRFLIQAVYTPILSLSNWNTLDNALLKFIQNKLTSLRIKLRKEIDL